jgi:hypothetical protein
LPQLTYNFIKEDKLMMKGEIGIQTKDDFVENLNIVGELFVFLH